MLKHRCIASLKSLRTSQFTSFSSKSDDLSHVKDNLPTMVDVSSKVSTHRSAHARAEIKLPEEMIQAITRNPDYHKEIYAKKGPVFATAIVAGVMAAKRTSDWIPFCHPIPIDGCDIQLQFKDKNMIIVDCIVKTHGKTGVEMEALVGVSNAALCVYDMLKAMSHNIVIQNIHLIKKSGGKSDYNNVLPS